MNEVTVDGIHRALIEEPIIQQVDESGKVHVGKRLAGAEGLLFFLRPHVVDYEVFAHNEAEKTGKYNRTEVEKAYLAYAFADMPHEMPHSSYWDMRYATAGLEWPDDVDRASYSLILDEVIDEYITHTNSESVLLWDLNNKATLQHRTEELIARQLKKYKADNFLALVDGLTPEHTNFDARLELVIRLVAEEYVHCIIRFKAG